MRAAIHRKRGIGGGVGFLTFGSGGGFGRSLVAAVGNGGGLRLATRYSSHCWMASSLSPDSRSITKTASLLSAGSRALTVSRPLAAYLNVTSAGVLCGNPGGRSRITQRPIGVESLPLASPPSTTRTTTLR